MRLHGALLAIALTLVVAGGHISPAGAEPQEPSTVTLQLKWLHQFQFAGYYAAIEKGFYRDVGLNVVLKEAHPGLDITGELLSGRADYLVNNPSILLTRAAGEPVVALAAIFQHSPLVIISREDSRILTPTDLVGRRCMLIPETETELVAMLVNEGVSLNRIKIFPHSWDISDLIEGRVDAMSAYLTDAPHILKGQNVRFNLIRALTYGIDFYGDVLITTQDEIDDHPKRVAAFRQASLKGWRHAMAHPEETVDLILRKYGSRLSREALLYEAEAMQRFLLPQLVDLGHMNPGRWQHIAKTYVDLGLLPSDFALEGFLYSPGGSALWNRDIWWAVTAILALSAVSVLVLLLFNRRLRSAVRKRTRELRDSEENLRQLADSMPQLVWSTDATGAVDYYNVRRLEFKGLSRKPDGTWEWTPVVHPKDTEATVKAWQTAVETGTTYQIEHRIQRADGSFAWFLSRATPIRDTEGNILRWYGTTTDIDELKRAQLDLIETKRAAEEASRIKSEFLATISHEIRTPITVFMGAVEHLLEISKDPDCRTLLDLADMSSKRLYILLNEVLDHSKIEARQMVLDETLFNVRECLDETLEMMKDRAVKKQLTLELVVDPAVPETMWGDPYRLGQILLNLIGNAIKFTDSGSVTVNVQRQGEQLEFSVRDTGVGIPENQLEDIFESFRQVDSSSTRRHGGAGLGLAISKGLTELMGGQIRVRSEVGQGSVFSFALPIKRPDKNNT